MNFYEQTSNCVSRLSPTEQNLFNYIIKNLHIVKDMSIRDLSEKCFVSTTSIFRLVKKLGYQGYAEFSQALRDTEEESRKIHIPSIVSADNYRDSYLKNVIEAVKVITDEKINKFNAIMNRNPNIFILAEGLSHEVGRYFYRLLTMMGFNTEMPDEEYEFVSVRRPFAAFFQDSPKSQGNTNFPALHNLAPSAMFPILRGKPRYAISVLTEAKPSARCRRNLLITRATEKTAAAKPI